MYPPLMPDSAATLDSITDGSIPGLYCFSVRWTRDGVPVKLTSLTPQQYFGLTAGGIPIDTSLVWYRIAPDSTRVLVGVRTKAITLDYTWSVTYDYAAESERAPIATVDTASGDTIFATAFYDLPVQLPTASVSDDDGTVPIPELFPNPSSRSISLDVSELSGPLDAMLISETGEIVMQESYSANHPSMLTFDLSSESSGSYLLRVSNGQAHIDRKCVLER